MYSEAKTEPHEDAWLIAVGAEKVWDDSVF